MHVLVLPSWYPTTEAPRTGIYFAEQVQCLQAHGLQMGVVYPEQQSLRRASWSALRQKRWQTEWTDHFGIPTLRQYGWNVWWRFPPGQRLRVRAAVRLGRRYVARRGVPDLLHAHSARWAGAAAARLGDELEIPYVLTEHFSGFQKPNGVFPWRWPLVEAGFHGARRIAAVSTALREAIASHGLALADEIAVQPNPVRTSFFTLPPEHRSPPPPLRFLTVARLRPLKNVSELLDAFATAFGESRAATLTIVGDGPERGPLKQQADRLGLTDQITFRGALDRAGVREALWDAHAFVLPSHHETFGVVLIEAMATGLPVVATRCGGPEDIVTLETGRLVPPDNTQALAEALRTMHRTHDTYDAASIRASALDRYGPEAFVRRTRNFYQRALPG